MTLLQRLRALAEAVARGDVKPPAGVDRLGVLLDPAIVLALVDVAEAAQDHEHLPIFFKSACPICDALDALAAVGGGE